MFFSIFLFLVFLVISLKNKFCFLQEQDFFTIFFRHSPYLDIIISLNFRNEAVKKPMFKNSTSHPSLLFALLCTGNDVLSTFLIALGFCDRGINIGFLV
jgi:hypothetical protein